MLPCHDVSAEDLQASATRVTVTQRREKKESRQEAREVSGDTELVANDSVAHHYLDTVSSLLYAYYITASSFLWKVREELTEMGCNLSRPFLVNVFIKGNSKITQAFPLRAQVKIKERMKKTLP